jgi:hypothetical protein
VADSFHLSNSWPIIHGNTITHVIIAVFASITFSLRIVTLGCSAHVGRLASIASGIETSEPIDETSEFGFLEERTSWKDAALLLRWPLSLLQRPARMAHALLRPVAHCNALEPLKKM